MSVAQHEDGAFAELLVSSGEVFPSVRHVTLPSTLCCLVLNGSSHGEIPDASHDDVGSCGGTIGNII